MGRAVFGREGGVDRLLRRAVGTLAVLLAAVAGCSADGAGRGGASPTPGGATATAEATEQAAAEPAVTLREAARELETLLAADDVARASGEVRLALELARDGQHAITPAIYRSAGLTSPRRS